MGLLQGRAELPGYDQSLTGRVKLRQGKEFAQYRYMLQGSVSGDWYYGWVPISLLTDDGRRQLEEK